MEIAHSLVLKYAPTLFKYLLVFIGYTLSLQFMVDIDEERTPEIWFSYSSAIGQACTREELVLNILSYKLVRDTLFGSSAISMTFFLLLSHLSFMKGQSARGRSVPQNLEAESF